jgi:hypothetical protein
MTYGEEGGDPDFEDDEESTDFSDADPGIAADTIAVDDSTLQPAKGDIP